MTRRIGLIYYGVRTHSAIYMDYLDHTIRKLGEYYIINLRFSKLQQIFRPRIILLIQVHPKKVYSRDIKKMPTGLRQGSNTDRLRQLRLAFKRHLLNQLRHYPPQKKEFHETMLNLISLNDPSERADLLRCANTLSYIHGLSGSYDTKAWRILYYKFKI